MFLLLFQNNNPGRAITYWRKGYFDPEYCESNNAYICQRSTAAAAAKEANGVTKF
jgi:hypothetical protein